MSVEHHNTEHPSRWQRVCQLTACLMLIWFGVTFATIFFARELSGLKLFGWPVPFYMAGQGLPLLYLAIVGVYAKRMKRLDDSARKDVDGDK